MYYSHSKNILEKQNQSYSHIDIDNEFTDKLSFCEICKLFFRKLNEVLESTTTPKKNEKKFSLTEKMPSFNFHDIFGITEVERNSKLIVP